MAVSAVGRKPLLRIGELANRTGFSTKTLRYYEEIGLVRPAERSESGYRLYSDEVLDRLRFVRRSRGLGLRLEDIKRILEISDEGRIPCEHVVGIVDREVAEVSEQMARLRTLRRDLTDLRARLIDAVETGSAGPGRACPCFENGDEPVEGGIEA
ncbi:MAG TPA: heavy metal-responsive transcriptional regulator [Dehalococcoidia bacterium]|nr:heavy metal-responsive transcriptional regulator [Dehalococcoidia bacterium]